jgi:D-3-phosphoglycerate dehydrogenase
VLGSAPRLKIIARDGVGYDNIDIPEATKRGIMVTNAPVLHESVADLAIGLMIAAVRRITIGDRGMRSGGWAERDTYLSTDIYGKTLGLIGFGRIAKAVAKRAFGFGMKVMAYDAYPDLKAADEAGVEMTTLDRLLSAADIVSLHAPLTDKTYRIINRENISKMKQGSYLINTSRGETVDEEALMEALASGKIAGAGLDVVCGEPPGREDPLFGFDNIVFTPHVGSDTRDTFLRVFKSAVKDISLLFSMKKPANLLNPEVLLHERFKNIAEG